MDEPRKRQSDCRQDRQPGQVEPDWNHPPWRPTAHGHGICLEPGSAKTCRSLVHQGGRVQGARRYLPEYFKISTTVQLSRNIMQRIMLAGGAGYIGSALATRLQELGYDVTVTDLFWFGSHLAEGIKSVEKNLFDCTKDDFAGFDQVVFLGGLSNDPMAEYSPADNFIYNAALPAYLAFESKKAG